VKRWAGALLGLFLATACGGGGGGGGGGGTPPPTVPPAGISYTVAGVAGANSIATTRNAGSTTTVLKLDLGAVDVTDLYGIAVDVFDPSKLFEVSSIAEGTFLSGEQTAFQFLEVSPGHLVFGLTRLGQVSGASGSGALIVLEFTSRGIAGTGTFSLDETAAFSSNGAEIAGVTWLGGSATVTP